MDNKTLVLLSKFSVSARKVIGSVNPAKLINDNGYSTEIFQKVAEFGDEELIMLSLEVQGILGPSISHCSGREYNKNSLYQASNN